MFKHNAITYPNICVLYVLGLPDFPYMFLLLRPNQHPNQIPAQLKESTAMQLCVLFFVQPLSLPLMPSPPLLCRSLPLPSPPLLLSPPLPPPPPISPPTGTPFGHPRRAEPTRRSGARDTTSRRGGRVPETRGGCGTRRRRGRCSRPHSSSLGFILIR